MPIDDNYHKMLQVLYQKLLNANFDEYFNTKKGFSAIGNFRRMNGRKEISVAEKNLLNTALFEHQKSRLFLYGHCLAVEVTLQKITKVIF